MSQYISTADLASYLRKTLHTASAQLAVDLTNGMVTDLIGHVDPVPVRVRAIMLEVAARGYRDGEDEESVTVTVDDRQKTVRRRQGKPGDREGFFLTDEERDEILGIVGTGGATRVGTIFTPPRFP